MMVIRKQKRERSTMLLYIDTIEAVILGGLTFAKTQQGDWVCENIVPSGCIMKINSVPDLRRLYTRADLFLFGHQHLKLTMLTLPLRGMGKKMIPSMEKTMLSQRMFLRKSSTGRSPSLKPET